jgi:hypothetical protein
MTSPHEPWPYPDLEPEPEYEPRRPHSRRRIRETPRWRAWREWPLWAWALLGVLVGLVVFLGWLALRDTTTEERITSAGVPVVPITSTPLASAPPPPRADLPEGAISGDVPVDAPHIVGVTVPAGRYVTAGALEADTEGRWERARFRSASNTVAPVANGSTTGAAEVELRVGDIFSTQGYKPWTKIR